MCGFTGFWYISRQMSNDYLPIIVQRISKSLIHRGLDDGVSWLDEEIVIGLLRDWAERLLNKGCLKDDGFFNPKPIRQK